MKTLYYDCFAGISGDMHLGAMIDLGIDPNFLITELNKLNLKGFNLEITKDKRCGISGTNVKVITESAHEHHHRHLHHITEIIQDSQLSAPTQQLAIKIFSQLAQAEAKVHNTTIEQIHFHEVGALDSIVDITGAAICLTQLNPEQVICSPVQLGGGTVTCAHGIMPVPAPATAELLSGIPVRTGLVNFEATTPTGAAILRTVVNHFTTTASLTIQQTGYGIGDREHPTVPNVLRAFIAETDSFPEKNLQESLSLIETNIDDMNPENYDLLLDQLLKNGALDAWLEPIVMKKNRPAVLLRALCKPEDQNLIRSTIFMHSTSIGIRTIPVKRTSLRRKTIQITTQFGPITVKQSYDGDQLIKSKPEYSECLDIAKTQGVSLDQVRQEVYFQLAQQKR